MKLRTIDHAQRGETLVALIRVELTQADPPTFLVFVRLGMRDGRTEQWVQTDDDASSACERYSRAVEDFVSIGYSLAEPTQQPPAEVTP